MAMNNYSIDQLRIIGSWLWHSSRLQVGGRLAISDSNQRLAMMNGTEMVSCMDGIGMMGPMGLGMGLLWILLLGLLVWGVYRLIRASDTTGSSKDSPLDALQRRYAEGEISTEEYEERKEILRS